MKDAKTSDTFRAYSLQSLSISSDITLEKHVRRKGTGVVRFESARLLDGHGNPSSEFHIGDDIHIQFAIRKSADVGKLTIAVELSTDDGLNLANMIDSDSGFLLYISAQRGHSQRNSSRRAALPGSLSRWAIYRKSSGREYLRLY